MKQSRFEGLNGVMAIGFGKRFSRLRICERQSTVRRVLEKGGISILTKEKACLIRKGLTMEL